MLGQTKNIDAYLVKMDSAGHKSWSRAYSSIYITSAIQTLDGGYLLGTFGSLVKINPVGAVTWVKTYQDISSFTSIIETLDGTGYAAIANGGGLYWNIPVLMKIDFNGNTQWSNTLNVTLSNASTFGAFVQLKTDSCFYMAGAYRYGGIYAACLLTKVSKKGKGLWNKIIVPANLSDLWYGSNISSKIRETHNGHLLLNVAKESTDLIEVDSSCAIIKVSSYSTLVKDWDLCRPLDDNSVYVTAQEGLQTNNRDLLIARIDASGVTQWAKNFGSVRDDYPSALMTTRDKGPIVVGTSRNFSFGSDDVYVVKTDSAGAATCNYTLNSSVTTSLSTATASTVSLPFDSIYHPMQQPGNLTPAALLDTTYDACSCSPPHADFCVASFLYYQLPDSSTWASTWHWDFGNGHSSNSPDVAFPFYGSPAGTYTVCLKVTNACGSDSVCKPVVYLPVGLKKEFADPDFNLFPNPADQEITLKSSHILGSITIYNTLGEPVLTAISKSTLQSIDVTALIKGMYVVYADGKFVKPIKE